jgi:hypothetical protein
MSFGQMWPYSSTLLWSYALAHETAHLAMIFSNGSTTLTYTAWVNFLLFQSALGKVSLELFEGKRELQ